MTQNSSFMLYCVSSWGFDVRFQCKCWWRSALRHIVVCFFHIVCFAPIQNLRILDPWLSYCSHHSFIHPLINWLTDHRHRAGVNGDVRWPPWPDLLPGTDQQRAVLRTAQSGVDLCLRLLGQYTSQLLLPPLSPVSSTVIEDHTEAHLKGSWTEDISWPESVSVSSWIWTPHQPHRVTSKFKIPLCQFKTQVTKSQAKCWATVLDTAQLTANVVKSRMVNINNKHVLLFTFHNWQFTADRGITQSKHESANYLHCVESTEPEERQLIKS